jgi:hypothetical protein
MGGGKRPAHPASRRITPQSRGARTHTRTKAGWLAGCAWPAHTSHPRPPSHAERRRRRRRRRPSTYHMWHAHVGNALPAHPARNHHIRGRRRRRTNERAGARAAYPRGRMKDGERADEWTETEGEKLLRRRGIGFLDVGDDDASDGEGWVVSGQPTDGRYSTEDPVLRPSELRILGSSAVRSHEKDKKKKKRRGRRHRGWRHVQDSRAGATILRTHDGSPKALIAQTAGRAIRAALEEPPARLP